jgi:hypothetical protein
LAVDLARLLAPRAGLVASWLGAAEGSAHDPEQPTMSRSRAVRKPQLVISTIYRNF